MRFFAPGPVERSFLEFSYDLLAKNWVALSLELFCYFSFFFRCPPQGLLLDYDFAIADPLAAGAALAQLVDADSALATKITAHLDGAVRNFGHSRSSATSPPPHPSRNDFKPKSGTHLRHFDGLEGYRGQESISSRRRRQLRGKESEAAIHHRYQNLVKMQW